MLACDSVCRQFLPKVTTMLKGKRLCSQVGLRQLCSKFCRIFYSVLPEKLSNYSLSSIQLFSKKFSYSTHIVQISVAWVIRKLVEEKEMLMSVSDSVNAYWTATSAKLQHSLQERCPAVSQAGLRFHQSKVCMIWSVSAAFAKYASSSNLSPSSCCG